MLNQSSLFSIKLKIIILKQLKYTLHFHAFFPSIFSISLHSSSFLSPYLPSFLSGFTSSASVLIKSNDNATQRFLGKVPNSATWLPDCFTQYFTLNSYLDRKRCFQILHQLVHKSHHNQLCILLQTMLDTFLRKNISLFQILPLVNYKHPQENTKESSQETSAILIFLKGQQVNKTSTKSSLYFVNILTVEIPSQFTLQLKDVILFLLTLIMNMTGRQLLAADIVSVW